MDEIRGAGKVVRKAYSYMLTEPLGTRNKEVRHLLNPYLFFVSKVLAHCFHSLKELNRECEDDRLRWVWVNFFNSL